MRILAALIMMTTLLRAQFSAPVSPSTAPANTSEQIETGRARLPNGTEVSYRIRLLPLASFPDIPAAIADQLQRRNCMIPQTYEARQPENVIHGAFENPASDDWAVLCSTSGSSTLYVFFQSRPATPMLLRHQRNDEWLGAEGTGPYSSAWGISTQLPNQLRTAAAHTQAIDHSGIEDSFLERSSTIHYFHDGGWAILNPK